ncbi:alanine/ornithine racemase family PLP-dependent enzyme [Muricauda sp. CAU 1633]|nr:alanine/ornithine racemase family PLP-dependent enzyme [Muricauda sp. CAU 1633]
MTTLYGTKGIKIIGVTKVIGGDPVIAGMMVKNGIKTLADSRLENIQRMRKAGIRAQFMLLKSPALSQAEEVITHTHISLNSELIVLKELSKCALKNHSIHKVILMVELGDLREGIMPSEMENMVRDVISLKGIVLIGIGTNLACLGGIAPDSDNMAELSSIAGHLENKFNISLDIVSGGSSANYRWFRSSKDVDRINSLRLGESIFLGRETLCREPIPGLFTDIFTLVAEVIEAKQKPSQPYGKVYQNMNGKILHFKDHGLMNRAILGIGLQDVVVSGIVPKQNVTILGASSDHIVVDNNKANLEVGDTVTFDLNYNALLRGLNSPYITKNHVNYQECKEVL